MSTLRAAVAVAGALLAAAAPAAAQSRCSAIADRGARLDCYDRAPRARAQASPHQGPHHPLEGICTPGSPCVGPRGGVHRHTPSGHRRYLPRG